MSQKELLALPVNSWADEQAHLYLWSTNTNLPDAFELMEAWGFKFVTIADVGKNVIRIIRISNLFSHNDRACPVRGSWAIVDASAKFWNALHCPEDPPFRQT